MINFLKAFVLIAGIALTLTVAVVAGAAVVDLFPGTTFDWSTGVLTYPHGEDYALIIGAIVSVIVTVAGFTATTVTFERVDDMRYR